MEGYFLVADLLGFGRIAKNLEPKDLDERIRAWTTLVQDVAAKCKVDNTQLISDTVFSAAQPDSEGLLKLLRFSKCLLEKGVAESFPIRGAISYGPYEWGSLTYGKAVIDAHELEKAQDWVGVTCANLLPHIEEVWGVDLAVCFPTPKIRGPIILHPVVSWAVPDFAMLASSLSKKGLTRKGETMDWKWGYKLTNTILFGMYTKMLRLAGGEAKRFHGLMPVEAIELNLFHKNTKPNV